MRNIKLVLAYDGTAFKGWQKTRMGPSVEEALQSTLEKLLQESVTLQAASRTDAGVHAEGQVVNFFTQNEIPLEKLQQGLNALLPKELVVLSSADMPLSFHPTVDCKGKEYRYSLCLGQQFPQHRLYSWHMPKPLNLTLMKEAKEMLIGTHNFSSFCNVKKNASYKTYVRTLSNIQLIEDQHRLFLHISGDHFLYKMVRNIVGTLVYIGQGRIALEELPEILASQKRTQAGVTAPAHGLSLYRIFY